MYPALISLLVSTTFELGLHLPVDEIQQYRVRIDGGRADAVVAVGHHLRHGLTFMPSTMLDVVDDRGCPGRRPWICPTGAKVLQRGWASQSEVSLPFHSANIMGR